MKKISCTRKIHFCSGHRVLEHEGACKMPHGHNYNAFITARAADLDSVGRVIDFSVLKEVVGGWIDRKWDHGFIIYEKDKVLKEFLRESKSKHYIMPTNPTAENMAIYLLTKSNELLASSGVEVIEVKIWETENCFAVAKL